MTALRTPSGQAVALAGVRSHLLPERIARASHPAVIAAVGAAFAISFDTISHALVFSMTGASMAGAAFAAVLGIVFTAGMALTDAASGLWVARLVRSADRRAANASRIMSIAIAFLCLVLAGLGFAKYPASAAPALSAASFAVVLAAYLAARRMRGGIRAPGTVLR
jgi:high-affinity nickel-transport protein